MKYIFVFVIPLSFINITAQSREWNTELSKDSITEVVYAIYDSLITDGEEATFIEYTAKTKTTASLESCAAVFNNPELHKRFYEYTEVSQKVNNISVGEWIIYYYYSPPWPIADSDCVSRITMKTDSLNNSIVFTSFSEPQLLEMKEVARSDLNNITFTFTQISNDEVEIFVEAILIPETPAPAWMMSSWFPEGPAGTLSRFKRLAENQ